MVGVGTAISAGLGFLYLGVVAKTLEIGEFGRYSLLTILLVSLSKLMDFGTNSLYISKTNESNLIEETKKLLGIKLILLLISIPISGLFLYLLDLLTFKIALLFLGGLLFYTNYYYLFAILQNNEQFLNLIFLVLFPALVKGTTAVLLLTGSVNMDMASMFGVFSLAIGTSFIFTPFLEKNIRSIKPTFKGLRDDFKTALSPGISQIISDGFPALTNSIAKVISSFDGVGIFALADKISSVFVFVSFSIFTVLLPKNATKKSKGEGFDFSEVKFLSGAILFLAVLIIIFAQWALPVFFDNKYNASLPILNILVFSSAITAIHTFMENYFFVEQKTNYLYKIYITKVLILILAVGILIPLIGFIGLAHAILLSSIVSLVLVIRGIKNPNLL